jgi:hypothetical protein
MQQAIGRRGGARCAVRGAGLAAHPKGAALNNLLATIEGRERKPG